MADFKTPLPIHRAAFARMATGLCLPDDAKKQLRTAFQAAERRGIPFREIAAAVSEIVGEHVWTWPRLEHQAEQLAALGLVPLEWEQERIQIPLRWADVPHGVRVRLLTGDLLSAVAAERTLSEFAGLKGSATRFSLALRSADPRCRASAAMVARHAGTIGTGNHTVLPPFFPGDRCHLSLQRVS
jgi:hypothetical protein